MGAKDDTRKGDAAAAMSAKTATTTLMNIASIVEKADEQVHFEQIAYSMKPPTTSAGFASSVLVHRRQPAGEPAAARPAHRRTRRRAGMALHVCVHAARHTPHHL